jgi:hypothetical protein
MSLSARESRCAHPGHGLRTAGSEPAECQSGSSSNCHGNTDEEKQVAFAGRVAFHRVLTDVHVDRERCRHNPVSTNLHPDTPSARLWKAEHASEQAGVQLTRRGSDPLTAFAPGSHVKCRPLDCVPAIDVDQPDREDSGGARAFDRHIDPRLCAAESIVPRSQIREHEEAGYGAHK